MVISDARKRVTYGRPYILNITCPECGFEDDDVYFAPKHGFVDWDCPRCRHIVDLVKLTGITPELASNADEIKTMMREEGF